MFTERVPLQAEAATVVVLHNMQQGAWVSDSPSTRSFLLGGLVECDETSRLTRNAKNRHTEDDCTRRSGDLRGCA